jgi:UV excision repair protein RAD23
LKLIHSGKILKDEDTIGSCGIQANDFLVVMVTKAKKAVAAAVPPVDTAVPSPATPTTVATPPPTAAATTAPAAPGPDEVVANLTAMGFPEPEVRHCLRAAHGNPDVAVEFLTNGIPEGAETADIPSTTPNATARPLQALRNHPQFDALRRLVQSNPAALQQVLTQIGQQQPDLLAEINAHQAAFLEMMNEPVAAAPAANRGTSAAPVDAMMEGLGGGAGNPMQMAQMIQSMSAEELQQVAAMMGLSPDQMRETAQMIGRMPPEQLNQFMMQFMGGGDGLLGGGGGQQVLHLTEEEMAAVDRLAELGFDRSDAAQAFLACDKNEALAANLLMDSLANGGLFGGDGTDGGGGGGDPDDEDDENMYD